MINKILGKAVVIVVLVVLAGGKAMAEGNMVCTRGGCANVARGADSGQSSISFAQLQQSSQPNLVITDVNEHGLLSLILDECIEDDPNEPNEPEKRIPLGGGGGGSDGSSSGLRGSNPYAGSGSSGLMSTSPAPQNTSPISYSDTLFAAAGSPIDNDTGGTITPTPYTGDGTTTVPEPATIAMLGLGSLVLRRRKKK